MNSELIMLSSDSEDEGGSIHGVDSRDDNGDLANVRSDSNVDANFKGVDFNVGNVSGDGVNLPFNGGGTFTVLKGGSDNDVGGETRDIGDIGDIRDIGRDTERDTRDGRETRDIGDIGDLVTDVIGTLKGVDSLRDTRDGREMRDIGDVTDVINTLSGDFLRDSTRVNDLSMINSSKGVSLKGGSLKGDSLKGDSSKGGDSLNGGEDILRHVNIDLNVADVIDTLKGSVGDTRDIGLNVADVINTLKGSVGDTRDIGLNVANVINTPSGDLLRDLRGSGGFVGGLGVIASPGMISTLNGEGNLNGGGLNSVRVSLKERDTVEDFRDTSKEISREMPRRVNGGLGGDTSKPVRHSENLNSLGMMLTGETLTGSGSFAADLYSNGVKGHALKHMGNHFKGGNLLTELDVDNDVINFSPRGFEGSLNNLKRLEGLSNSQNYSNRFKGDTPLSVRADLNDPRDNGVNKVTNHINNSKGFPTSNGANGSPMGNGRKDGQNVLKRLEGLSDNRFKGATLSNRDNLNNLQEFNNNSSKGGTLSLTDLFNSTILSDRNSGRSDANDLSQRKTPGNTSDKDSGHYWDSHSPSSSYQDHNWTLLGGEDITATKSNSHQSKESDIELVNGGESGNESGKGGESNSLETSFATRFQSIGQNDGNGFNKSGSKSNSASENGKNNQNTANTIIPNVQNNDAGNNKRSGAELFVFDSQNADEEDKSTSNQKMDDVMDILDETPLDFTNSMYPKIPGSFSTITEPNHEHDNNKSSISELQDEPKRIEARRSLDGGYGTRKSFSDSTSNIISDPFTYYNNTDLRTDPFGVLDKPNLENNQSESSAPALFIDENHDDHSDIEILSSGSSSPKSNSFKSTIPNHAVNSNLRFDQLNERIANTKSNYQNKMRVAGITPPVEIISIDSDSEDENDATKVDEFVDAPTSPNKEGPIDISDAFGYPRPSENVDILAKNVFQNDRLKEQNVSAAIQINQQIYKPIEKQLNFVPPAVITNPNLNETHPNSLTPKRAQESDDEIEVLEADAVANKKFKPSFFDMYPKAAAKAAANSSFSSANPSSGPSSGNPFLSQAQVNPQSTAPLIGSQPYHYYYNQPAPVTHSSDLTPESKKNVLIEELKAKERLSFNELQNLKSTQVSTNLSLQNLRSTALAIRGNILNGMDVIRRYSQQGVMAATISIREKIEKSKAELQKVLNHIDKTEHQSNAYQKREQQLSQSLRQIKSLIQHYLGHLTHPYAYGSFPQEESNRGYSQNVYDDNQDLQNLLDNIKSDENLEEGLEFTPKEMSINLMKHQRMGLTWLKRMEESKSHGGILADDMGLGKTIQTIALIVANPPKEDEPKTTLIIGPVSLLRQWAAEIESKLKPECALKIAIYHGAEKRNLNTFQNMKKYDILLTSYGTLSSEWKKHFLEVLVKAQEDKVANFIPKTGTGGKSYTSPFYTKDSNFHRIILDEAQNIKNKLSIASRSVSSIEAIYRFCLSGTPIQNNIDELYPIIRFLRIRPYNSFIRFRADISIPMKDSTNYDSSDRDSSMNKVRAILKAILLRRTKTTMIDGKPLLTLPKKHVISEYVKMEKSESEFYASLEDLTKRKAEKLLHSKTKHSASSILTLLLRLRQACIHKYLVEIGEMKGNQNSNSVHAHKPKDFTKLFFNIKNLDPSIILMVKRITGSENAKRESLSGVLTPVILPKNEANEDLLMADEQKVVKFDNEINVFAEETKIDMQEGDDAMITCPLCLDLFSTDDSLVILSKCGHIICLNCIDTFFDTCEVDSDSNGVIAECKDCKAKVRPPDLINYKLFHVIHNEGYDLDEFSAICRRYYGNVRKDDNSKLIKQLVLRDEGFKPSVKIEKSVELIQKIFKEKQEEKVIIFSQFTTLFDLLKLVLDREGIQFLRYDGSMNLEDKNSTIKAFYQSNIKVLLISLRAGNVGLTLTCASHVIIMDPFWNPYVEEQAQDRAHRIGQAREVFVHRILIEGTVESRIMELQQSKKELVGSALDENGMKSVSKLGRNELGFLFGLNRLT